MQNEIMVSICVLTYMHEKYIEDCIKGILAQTYTGLMEIIFLDDASEDKTFSIIKKYKHKLESKFIKIILIRNNNNSGNVSCNYNVMIEQSHGKYLKLLSGDDIMKANCIHRLVTELEMHPDYILCYANTNVVGDDYKYGDPGGGSYFFDNHKEYPQNEIFERLMKLCYLSPANLIRREAFEQYGLFDENISYEDYDMWLRLSKKEKFLYIPARLEFYRRSEKSMTNYKTKGGKERFVHMMREEQKVIKKHLKGLRQDEKVRYIGYFFDRFIWASKDAGLWEMYLWLMVRRYFVINSAYL